MAALKVNFIAFAEHDFLHPLKQYQRSHSRFEGTPPSSSPQSLNPPVAVKRRGHTSLYQVVCNLDATLLGKVGYECLIDQRQ